MPRWWPRGWTGWRFAAGVVLIVIGGSWAFNNWGADWGGVIVLVIGVGLVGALLRAQAP